MVAMLYPKGPHKGMHKGLQEHVQEGSKIENDPAPASHVLF